MKVFSDEDKSQWWGSGMFLACASCSIIKAEAWTAILAAPLTEGAYSRLRRANSQGCRRRALFFPPKASTPASYISFGVMVLDKKRTNSKNPKFLEENPLLVWVNKLRIWKRSLYQKTSFERKSFVCEKWRYLSIWSLRLRIYKCAHLSLHLNFL